MEYDQILYLIAAGDKIAPELLYRQYGERFYSYAIHRWNMDEEAAWDVVYDTLDTLLLKLPDYKIESQAHFNNLIFKIFINALRQAFRKLRKHQYDIVYVDFSEEDTESQEEKEYSDGDVIIKGREEESYLPVDTDLFNRDKEEDIMEIPLLSAMKQALAEMNETDRNILLLHAQNYSYAEIAQMLNIENKHLKVKHHRCKEKLRKLFENHQTAAHEKEKQHRPSR